MAKSPRIGEHTGDTDANEDLVQIGVSTAQYFSWKLKQEQDALDKIRSEIISNKDAIVRLSGIVERDEYRLRLGEQRIAVWEFALVKAKALGELTSKSK